MDHSLRIFEKYSFSLLIAFLFLGCGHVISQQMRTNVDETVVPKILFENPESFKGKRIILGGIIINSKNETTGTYIEVLQKPLDYRGRPEETDLSYGRFLIFYKGYLDTAIYSAGREITVAGELLGGRQGRIGETEYQYPLVNSDELHLFRSRRGMPFGFSFGIWHTF